MAVAPAHPTGQTRPSRLCAPPAKHSTRQFSAGLERIDWLYGQAVDNSLGKPRRRGCRAAAWRGGRAEPGGGPEPHAPARSCSWSRAGSEAFGRRSVAHRATTPALRRPLSRDSTRPRRMILVVTRVTCPAPPTLMPAQGWASAQRCSRSTQPVVVMPRSAAGSTSKHGRARSMLRRHRRVCVGASGDRPPAPRTSRAAAP